MSERSTFFSDKSLTFIAQWPAQMAQAWQGIEDAKAKGQWEAVQDDTRELISQMLFIEEGIASCEKPWPPELVAFEPVFRADLDRARAEFTEAWVYVEMAKNESLAELQESLSTWRKFRDTMSKADPTGQNPLSQSADMLVQITEAKIQIRRQQQASAAYDAIGNFFRNLPKLVLGVREIAILTASSDPFKAATAIEEQKAKASRIRSQRLSEEKPLKTRDEEENALRKERDLKLSRISAQDSEDTQRRFKRDIEEWFEVEFNRLQNKYRQ